MFSNQWFKAKISSRQSPPSMARIYGIRITWKGLAIYHKSLLWPGFIAEHLASESAGSYNGKPVIYPKVVHTCLEILALNHWFEPWSGLSLRWDMRSHEQVIHPVKAMARYPKPRHGEISKTSPWRDIQNLAMARYPKHRHGETFERNGAVAVKCINCRDPQNQVCAT